MIIRGNPRQRMAFLSEGFPLQPWALAYSWRERRSVFAAPHPNSSQGLRLDAASHRRSTDRQVRPIAALHIGKFAGSRPADSARLAGPALHENYAWRRFQSRGINPFPDARVQRSLVAET